MADNIVVNGVHNYSTEDKYVVPTDPLVKERLEWFQDQKLGFMVHWGTYSQMGIVESWAMSDEDESWSRKEIDWIEAEDFKKQYVDLNESFNPTRFEPEKWAELAAEGGFKYCIFTTKHHDGFCMWDTKYTDYKITNSDCPFSTHKYSDVCKHLFDAMREKGLAIFPYFSKADWNVPSYWAEPGKYDNTARGHNYDVKENPELWEEFVQFTHNQILELATNYGKIDAVWLDAGWVNQGDGEDIRIEELIEKARELQPGLISADRTCGGICEDYVTPEQTIPEKPMNIPWESCITIGNSFSYRFDDTYKSVFYLVQLLIDVVAKGGNLALNVGPQPDGRLPKDAVDRIKGLGEFMNVYGDSIYGTRVCAPYRTGNYAFTKKENSVFAFYMYDDETHEDMDKFVIPYSEKVNKVTLMRSNKALDFNQTNEGIEVFVDEDTTDDIATVFVIE